MPAEYRADFAATLRHEGAAVMGIIVESQTARDPRKRFTWPLYAAALHAKLECATCLVVLAADDDVAAWAAEPIATLQPGVPFVPIVLGPQRVPIITSAGDAQRAPELAVLSVLAHGRDDHGREIGRAALKAAANLDEERRTLYTDFILFALSGTAREALEIEMNLTDYEFKSEFFKKKLEQEAARGEVRAEARALLKFLAARGIPVTEANRARILACTDIPTLDRWVERAATAKTAEEVLRDG